MELLIDCLEWRVEKKLGVLVSVTACLNIPVCLFARRHVTGSYEGNKRQSKPIKHESTTEQLPR